MNLPIRYRLILLITITVFGAGLSISYFGMLQYERTIISEAVNHLKTIREFRIHDIREHLQEELYDLDMLTSQPAIQQALTGYDSHNFGPGITSISHINASRLVSKQLTYYQEKSRAYDIFLISPAGDIIYTVAKEADLGTSLVSGKHKKSELAIAFQRSKQMLQEQISPVAYYEASGEMAIFLATPVFKQEKIIGFIAIQLDLSELNSVITSLTGLGKSGEVVAVTNRGSDALLIAPLRHQPMAAMSMMIPLDSEWGAPLQRAFQGNVGNGTLIDYRGKTVEAAWGYIPELEIGLMVKIDMDELLEPVVTLKKEIIAVVLVILLLVIFPTIIFSRSITRPIEKLQKTTSLYAHGTFDIRSEINSTDEIGQLAATFNTMADNMKDYNRQIREKNSELASYSEQLEQRVEERTATLAAANEEIKSFAYIVSHDLRSPLVNMKGFTGELDYTLKEVSAKIAAIESRIDLNERQEMQQLIEEDIPESMKFITTSVERMDHMLTAILNLSRMGRRSLKIEAIDLHALCSETLSTLAYQIEQHATEIELGYLPVIQNDRIVLEQMMGNLIGNAIKYLDPERPGKIKISSTQSNSGISISVRDNGRGILPQEEEKVFQIFRRGIHQDVEGEGMGLSYVQTLVRAQGGSISFEPAADFGTVFTIFIPIQKSRDTI